jgi:hypothetical protein
MNSNNIKWKARSFFFMKECSDFLVFCILFQDADSD